MGTLGLAWHGLSVLAAAASIGAAGDVAGTESGHLGRGELRDRGRPPVTMAEFKDGMLHSYATARDAFAALDASLMDLDAALDEDPLDIHEFVRGTKNFKPPLTEEQATYAFKGLDVDNSHLLEAEEFVDGIKSGVFFRVTTTTTLGEGQVETKQEAPITMSEFKSSMLRVYSSAPYAFAALDASETDLYAGVDQNPINLRQFVHGTQTFYPPLNRAQAEYAFKALDSDSNGVLVSAEFAEGLARGEFELPETTSPRKTTTGTATSTTLSTTITSSTTTATITPTPLKLLPRRAFISMDEFKARMLTAHDTSLRAFQALGANPAGLADFIRGTKTFEPPLSDDQATYAFRGLDADHDNAVSSFEFFEVLEFGRFFPTLRDLVLMGAAGSAGAAGGEVPRPLAGIAAGRAAGAPPGTSTPAPGGPGLGGRALQAVALVTVVPLLCALLPCARGLWQHLAAKSQRLESYKVVRTSSPSHRSSEGPRQPQYPSPKRSRLFGSGGIFSCCVQSSDDTEDPPLLLDIPCMKPADRPC